MTRRRSGLTALACLATLLLAGCSGGDTLPEGITVASATATATPPASATATASPSPSATPDATPTSITIAFTGDVMLDRDVEGAMVTSGAGYPFEAAKPLFEGADLAVVNLEGTFTDAGNPLAKQYVFATAPELAAGLLELPVWAVSLSNNHATDYGVTGLRNSLGALDAQDLRYFGAGLSEGDARAALVTDPARGPRVGFLGYSDIGETVFASGAEGGVSRASVAAITADIAALRAARRTDFIVVTLHMGTEYTRVVTARQQELARAAIEAGAALVVGHHPHVLQQIEEYRASDGRRGLILYSLGNFVFDLDADDLVTLGEGPFQSVVAHVTFEVGKQPVLDLRPARIDVAENRPRPATPDEAEAILKLLRPG